MPPRIYYRLADGVRVYLPRDPIDKAELKIPGWVTRPDGRRFWVEVEEEDPDEKNEKNE